MDSNANNTPIQRAAFEPDEDLVEFKAQNPNYNKLITQINNGPVGIIDLDKLSPIIKKKDHASRYKGIKEINNIKES